MTAIVGRCTEHLVEHTEDKSGLGRWTMARIRGKGNKCMSVFTAYCPSKKLDPGPDTVY